MHGPRLVIHSIPPQEFSCRAGQAAKYYVHMLKQTAVDAAGNGASRSRPFRRRYACLFGAVLFLGSGIASPANTAVSAAAVPSLEAQCEGHDAAHAPGDEEALPREAPAGAAQPDGGYLTGWLVAAPLVTGACLTTALRCADGTNPAPRENEALKDHETRWIRYRGEGNLINLREIAGYDLSVGAVAYCEFDSDAAQRGHIHFVSQNALRIWLNGNLVFEKPAVPYEPLNWLGCGVELRQGVNSCLLVCSDTAAEELFGFALRVDGPEVTPPPPLVWNPIVPGVPFIEDGCYKLLSPDWRWMEGDDPAWAGPGFDDSNWKIPAWPPVERLPEPGVTYWMRVRAHFAPGSTLVPYSFVWGSVWDVEVYVDGIRIPGRSSRDSLLDPFHYRDTTVQLPEECTLAARVVSAGPWHPIAHLAVRRADKAMSEELRVGQPRKHHRLFLVFLLASSVVYYLLVYRNHPRQIEGTVCCVTVALACLSMLNVTTDSWTFNHQLPMAAWTSPVLAAVAYTSAIAMAHVMAYGAVSWVAILVYGELSVILFALGWIQDTRWIAFSIFPLMTFEYLRVWTMYDLIPRRANRGYIGIGLFFLVVGLIVSALYGVSNGHQFSAAGPYAHLYGIVGLAACLVMYTSREAALGMHKLQALTAKLEDRVAERTRQVEQLTHRLITAGDAERERLSRDLHDSVAQTLWSAKMTAENLPGTAIEDPRKNELVGLLDKAIGEVRTIAYGLRPPELDKLGFLQAISHLCKDFSYATGILLDYEVCSVDNGSLSAVAEVNLYRVLQEALNNVQQHAGASSVRVRLVGAFPSVILRVEDNGKGFDTAAQSAVSDREMGLRSMEERVRLLGGTMRIRSAPGEGVRLAVEIPQQKKDD